MAFKIFIFLVVVCIGLVFSKIRLTNVVCQSLDKSYCDYDYCVLKVVNRTHKYLSARIKLFKVPASNGSLNLAVYSFANGYKPFLYNLTIDLCAFLRRRNNPVIKYLYAFAEPYTNVNHSCPYDHDLILEKLYFNSMDSLVTKVLPVPPGRYKVRTIWSAFNVPRAFYEIYAEIE